MTQDDPARGKRAGSPTDHPLPEETVMTAERDAQLAAYFETRARQREQEIDDRLAELTPRERSLVRDAAVMGYVLGRMDERAKVEFPKDTPIFRGVVLAALRDDENFHVLRGACHEYTEPAAAS